MKCQLYVVPQVGTPEGRQRIRECLEGATEDSFNRMLVEATKCVDRQAEQIEAKDAEIERLKADIRIMVEKAADTHLAGYRELGSKLAAREQKIDEIKKKLNAKDAVLTYLRDNVSRDNMLSIQSIETLCKQGLRGNKNAVKNMEKSLKGGA